MNNKYLHLKALKRIIDEKTPFQVVLEKAIHQNNLSESDKFAFRMDVLGSLRHFYQLQFEATTAFPEFLEDDDEIYLVILALYELRYHSKDIAAFEVIGQTIETIEYMSLRLDYQKTNVKLNYLANHKTPLPDSLKSDPYSYNALFFNTPKWIIEMWNKDYGDDIAMNILIANQRRYTQFLTINTLNRKIEDFSDDERFTIPAIVSNALEYRSGPCSNLTEVADGDLFAQDLSNQIMLNCLTYTFKQKTLHIGAISGGIAANIAIRTHDIGGNVDALYSNEKRYARGKYLASRLGVDNMNRFYGDLKIMKTHSPYASYNTVIFSPLSSRLGQTRRRPDILPTLQEQDIERFVSNIKKNLEEVQKFVAEEGTLVYCVPTITKVETIGIVHSFLENHLEYKLDYERQIFPSEYGSDGFYFAIIKK